MIEVETIGNLGGDATIKEINGQKYVAFNVASTEKYKNASGTTVERTTWVSALLRGDGGALTQYLTKGTTVFLRGDLSISAFVDKDGKPQASISLFVNRIQLCGSKK